MTSLTVGRMRMVCGIVSEHSYAQRQLQTYMLKLGRVRALLVHQWGVGLDNSVGDEVIQLFTRQ